MYENKKRLSRGRLLDHRVVQQHVRRLGLGIRSYREGAAHGLQAGYQHQVGS
jgi:hypothetical protein